MIGENMKQAREAKSWSQAHLAQAAGINVRTIQRIEAGEACAPETLLCIAAALGVDAATLRGSCPTAEPASWRPRPFSRTTTIAALAGAPGLVFVGVNLLKYGLGIPQPFDWLAAAGGRVMTFETFDRLSPFLFVGGLAAAILLCLADQVRPRFRHAPGLLTVTGIDLRLRSGGLALLLVCLFAAASLFAYAVGENLGPLLHR
jgi:transcriptional regulator with XRE-family HTH domain